MSQAALLDFPWSDAAAAAAAAAGDGSPVWRSFDGTLGRAFGPAGVSGWTAVQPLRVLAGATPDAQVLWHYAVETDVAPEHDAPFNAWYEGEHLPGLAAVPGTIRARRYLRLSGGPRYIACYDLASPAAMERPEWLAVRATDWSSRIRPLFVGPRRTLFARADAWAALTGAARMPAIPVDGGGAAR